MMFANNYLSVEVVTENTIECMIRSWSSPSFLHYRKSGPGPKRSETRADSTGPPIESANSAPPSLNSFVSAVPIEDLSDRGYTLEGTIKSRAGTQVKKGVSLKNDETVAVKVYDLEKTQKHIIKKFLPREVITLKTLQGKDGVVQLIDYFMTSHHLFIVMEYAENGNLWDYITENVTLTEWTSRRFYLDILHGLSSCHRLGISHRDLNCENILLDCNYKLKLADFGFARFQHSDELLQTYCGSLAYKAPEVALEKPYAGKPSDVWSSGIVLYVMLTGELPFEDTHPKAIVDSIHEGPRYPYFVKDTCRELISKILNIDPKERYSIERILQHHWMRVDPEASMDGYDYNSLEHFLKF